MGYLLAFKASFA